MRNEEFVSVGESPIEILITGSHESRTGIPKNIYPNVFFHQIFFIPLPRTITILPYFSKEASFFFDKGQAEAYAE